MCHSVCSLPAPKVNFMEAFFFSTFSVALAEIGDKTQLLAFLLISRFRKPWPIIWGILVATLANHAIAGWLGAVAADWLQGDWLNGLVGGSFIAVGLWILIPDKLDDDTKNPYEKYGAFLATVVLFFIAEIGDKTQVATIILGAQFDALFWVVMGTTVGMMLANVPVVAIGHLAVDRLPLKWIRIGASGVFVLLGIWVLLSDQAIMSH
ncbi:Putative Ca2+/H+ antiporter, TMEM165/GDT1 family [Oceanospirillum linum]|nr:Putative Ca2+/H+ antiporter, TMEM165/GDT1 family [Oleiphilus messinensis]SMP00621.1 Putative Ca2+/H+ antiporter, TMEM165/GDT1 family [Oceanospirillum linum]